jgi:DNA polymerase
MKPPKRVTLDFETRSKSNLKTEGAYKYSLDPSTRPTCLAFKARDTKVTLLTFEEINRPWKELPREFRSQWSFWISNGYLFCAHNAFFETCIYKNVLVKRYGWPDIPFERFRCTAAKAAACALPRSLEGAGASLDLAVQKDKAGYIAMMQTCKPTREWNAWVKAREQAKAGKKNLRKATIARAQAPEPPVFLEPDAAPEVFHVLYTYCKIDVKTEELLDMTLPDLIEAEQEIWFLNQRLNWRGLRVDVPTCKKVVGIMAGESVVRLKELDALTMGLVTKPGAIKSILEFLALEGIELPNLRAKTVEDILSSGKLSPDMQRLLEIRKALSKTSTKKYQAMLDRAMPDWRCRDILLYHGASTGRDTGVGLQPHNFPKPVIDISKDRPYAAVENVIACDPETLRMLYGESLALLFSSILRNMIIASEGCELYVADFSKIEVAVVWWLSGNIEGLKILNAGKDPYIYMAAANTGKSYEEIEQAIKNGETWAEDARQLGKAQVLGCGFGMGWKKFKNTAWDFYRLRLTGKQSRKAVTSYREANEAVPQLWQDYESAAIAAIENKGEVFEAGKCLFSVRRGFLWVKLPSGRKLAYRKPRLGWVTPIYEVEEVWHKGEWVKRDDFDDDIEAGKITEAELDKKRSRVREVEGRPKRMIEFLGLDKSKKKLAMERTWGGTLTENIVQATARDLMMPAMVRLEKNGYTALLMVHDEGICEKKKGAGSVEEFVKILCTRPAWADKHLPLDAKGWIGPRYRK